MSEAFKPAPDPHAVLTAQFIIGALMRDIPFPKRLRKLEKLEDQADRALTAAVDRSNVYSLLHAMKGQRPEQMDAERQLKRNLAVTILHAIEAERRVIASYGFPSPGHPAAGGSR